MPKKFLVFTFLIVIFFAIDVPVFADSTFVSGISQAWARTYGPSSASCVGVFPAAAGGYFAAGSTKSFGAGSSDVWVMKLDASGNPTMQKTYGGSGRDDVVRLVPLPDGGFAVIGLSTSFGALGHAPLILRFDLDGNLVFKRTLLTAGREWGFDVQLTSDNGYVIAGGIDIGWTNNVKAAAVKLNASGAIDWQWYYCNGNLNAIRQLPGGGYIAAGRTDPNNGYDLLLMKLDTNGVDIWRKVYGGSGIEGASDIQLLPGGGFLVAGWTGSFGSGDVDVWVMKLDADGNRIWQKVYGGASYDDAYSIELTGDGGSIVGARTYSFGPNPPNAYVLKLDTDGNPLWERIYDLGASGDETAPSVRSATDGGYIIAGGAGPGDPSLNGTYFAVLKTKPDGTVSPDCPAGVGDLIHSTVQATFVDPVPGPSGIGNPGFSSNDVNVLSTNTAVTAQDMCSIPVVLVHGWKSGPGIWNDFKQWLQDSGFTHIWVANNLLPCGAPGETNFSVNAESLSAFIERQIDALKAQTGVEAQSINIVAHSMGGLISRRYISGSEGWAHRRKVNNLIMLGTPNTGTTLGNLGLCVLKCAPASCELGSFNMLFFNLPYHNDSSTFYYAASGSGGRSDFACKFEWNNSCALACLGSVCLKTTLLEDCPNDGIVSRSSAEGLTLPPNIFSLAGPAKEDIWCHTNYYHSSYLFNSFVLPILKGQPVASEASVASNKAVEESPPPQLSFTKCDSIMPSQARSDSIRVEGGAVNVLLLTNDSMLTFSLESPNGVVWDSAATVLDTNVSYSRGVDGSGFLFTNADTGRWLVHYNTQSLSLPSANFCLLVALNNAIILRTAISEDYPLPGSPIILTATLTDNSAPITGATVTALPIHEQTDTLSIMTLLDDGNHHDGAAGDGVYGEVFNQPIDSGLVTFDLVATGTASSVGSFLRQASLAAYIYQPCLAKPGDANASMNLSLADIISTVNYIFNKPGFPSCPSNSVLCWLSDLLCRGDWNGSGNVSLPDVIQGVNYIFDKDRPANNCLGTDSGNCWTPIPSGACCLPVP